MAILKICERPRTKIREAFPNEGETNMESLGQMPHKSPEELYAGGRRRSQKDGAQQFRSTFWRSIEAFVARRDRRLLCLFLGRFAFHLISTTPGRAANFNQSELL
jgi:hypothetical protein